MLLVQVHFCLSDSPERLEVVEEILMRPVLEALHEYLEFFVSLPLASLEALFGLEGHGSAHVVADLGKSKHPQGLLSCKVIIACYLLLLSGTQSLHG